MLAILFCLDDYIFVPIIFQLPGFITTVIIIKKVAIYLTVLTRYLEKYSKLVVNKEKAPFFLTDNRNIVLIRDISFASLI